MSREEYVFEVPVTLRFTVSRSGASPQMPSDLAECRVQRIQQELADATHVEDFDIDLDDKELVSGPAGATYTGP